MTKPTILLIGLGGLGSIVLEFLAREESVGKIIAAGRKREQGTARCHLATLSAMAQGSYPTIDFERLDLNNVDETAHTIKRIAPDLILSTATLQTWWLPGLLPAPQSAVLNRAGFGMWLPVHLTLTLKLMQAVKQANFRGITLTAPFPDVINPILAALHLTPTCGIGNLDEIVPKVRLLAAHKLKASRKAVRVLMVGHHALQAAAFGAPDGEIPPYFLRVELNGKDVTEEIEAHQLLRAPYPVTSGTPTHFLTAGSTMRLVRALFSEADTLLHAPAPRGLPGGYPIIAGQNRVQVAPITGLRLDQAIAINEASHRFDGIERIEPDGTAVFVPESAQVFRSVLGYDCDRLHPNDAEARAEELIARFRAYATRLGVDLDQNHI